MKNNTISWKKRICIIFLKSFPLLIKLVVTAPTRMCTMVFTKRVILSRHHL